MQRLGVLSVLVLLASHAFAGTGPGYTTNAKSPNCSLKIEELKPAPDLYGLHIGMTTAEVRQALPLAEFQSPTDRLGVMSTRFRPHVDPRVEKTAFPDVSTISLDFLDGKLATVLIVYESSFKWPKIDEFVANFSKALGVPGDWPVAKFRKVLGIPVRPTFRDTRELSCDGFSLTAQMIDHGPTLGIHDEAAQEVASARLTELIDADKKQEKQLVGDTRTKLYYPSSCLAKSSIPQDTRAVFKDNEEAEAAGYTLSRDCPVFVHSER